MDQSGSYQQDGGIESLMFHTPINRMLTSNYSQTSE
jgi:hypothetical protein